ncbi:DUF3466 family protein [Kangiella taiwanensis]|uniref:DUF3466 family protein n=1 Tax=Kangiella taiwanensis TaxID=1079179 RepID=A0ABP8I6L4_9GAMM|nr:DUF3466 family protein [Kangiella taiwanensis]
MKFKMTKTLLALSISAMTSASLAAPYEVVDLGGLGGTMSVAFDVNQAGQVVGYASVPSEENEGQFFAHAALFDESGNTDLGVYPEGTISQAVGINDAMTAVGFSNKITESTSDGSSTIVSDVYATIFEMGNLIELPSQENVDNTRAFGINNNNQIFLVGRIDLNPDDELSGTDRGFIYDRNTDTYSMVTPFTDDISKRSYITGINDNGRITGFTDFDISDSETTIKSYIASVDDIETLEEIPSIDNRAIFAQGINMNDEVVGSIYISGTRDLREAFYINMSAGDSEITTLGFIDPRFNDSRARDINNMGQVVGKALVSVPTLDEYAAFIHEDGEMKDLNTLISCDSGWKLTEATAINDSGQIVGFGSFEGEVRAFRLDPTGEPVEDCGTEEPGPSDGGGSLPVALVAILAALGLRRRLS